MAPVGDDSFVNEVDESDAEDGALNLSNQKDKKAAKNAPGDWYTCLVCCRDFKMPVVSGSSKQSGDDSIITVETNASSQNDAAAKRSRIKNAVCGACKKYYSRSKASNPAIFTEKCTCPDVRIAPNPATDRNADGRARKLSTKHMCRACRARRCHAAIMLDSKASGITDETTSIEAALTAPTPTGSAFPVQLPSILSTSDSNSRDNIQPRGSVIVPRSRSREDSSPLPSDSQLQQANPSSSSTSNRGDRINVRMIPCEICGVSSSGYHFGVISCEGCKGFFRRSITKNKPYKCKLPDASELDKRTREHQMRCKRCRFEACITAGMSLSAVQTGRHSMQRKIETSAYVKRLAAENKLLSMPIMRGSKMVRSGSLKLDADCSSQSYLDDIKSELLSPAMAPQSNGMTPGHRDDDESDDESEEVEIEGGDLSPASLTLSLSQPSSVLTLPSPSFASTALGSPHQTRPIQTNLKTPFPGQDSSNTDVPVIKRLRLGYEAEDANQIIKATALTSSFQGNKPANILQGTICWNSAFNAQSSAHQASSSSSWNSKLPLLNSASSTFAEHVGLLGPPSDLMTRPPVINVPQPLSAPTPYMLQAMNIDSVQTMANRLVESSQYLGLIGEIPELRLSFDMDPLNAWTDVMHHLFDRFVNSISSFVRLLPGFRELCQSDRVVLFSQAYFPILVAQLSLGYDIDSRHVDFFRETTPECRQMLKFLLCGPGDLLERQMSDAGYTIATWKPNTLEFSLLCGLLFFDPEVPELVEPEKIRQISEAYRLADEAFNAQRDSLESTEGSVNQVQKLSAPARFSSLVRYMKPMYQLLGLVCKSIEQDRPDFVHVHPLWSELHRYLTAKLSTLEGFSDAAIAAAANCSNGDSDNISLLHLPPLTTTMQSGSNF